MDISRTMTALRGWEEPVNFVDTASIPLTFIFEHIHKHIPSAIADRPGKMMVAYHVPYSKTFNEYGLVLADKLSACLMQKVLSLVRYLLMLPCKPEHSLASVTGTLSLSGYKTLKGLLQGLGIHSFEPFKFGVFLHLCQGSRRIMVIQTFLLAAFILCIVVNALTQKVVIGETDTTKVLLKHFSLLSIGIYSEFECLVYYHT